MQFTRQRYAKILMVLAVLAMFDSLYLTFVHYAKSGGWCDALVKSSCDVVNKGPYAEVFGIPIAVYAFFTFLIICILTWYIKVGKKIESWDIDPLRGIQIITLLLGIGFVTGMILVYVQMVVLHRYCFFCLVLDGLIVSSVIVAIGLYRTMKKEER